MKVEEFLLSQGRFTVHKEFKVSTEVFKLMLQELWCSMQPKWVAMIYAKVLLSLSGLRMEFHYSSWLHLLQVSA